MISAAVAGASGYAGGEIVRLLLGHPQIELGAVTADSQAGKRLGDVHPHLAAVGDRILEPTTRDTLRGHDVVFLALPHGASAELAAQLPEDTVVVDCGADYRLDRLPRRGRRSTEPPTPAPGPTGCPSCRSAAAFVRDELKGATRIAVPGLLPDRLLPRAGARVRRRAARARRRRHRRGQRHVRRGQGPQAAPARLGGDGRDVAVRRGRRAPAYPRDRAEPRARRRRAGLAVLHPDPRADGPGHPRHLHRPGPPRHERQQLREAWRDAYDDEPFVHLLPEGQWPRTSDVLGSNAAHLQLTLDESVGRVVVVAAIDNLTKGTAGGAIQCANLALGLPETAGLPVAGVAP